MKNAIDYVGKGIALINIPPHAKGPITTGWNEEKNVITTQEAAAKLTGNVGIAHAYCSPMPTMALDIDDMALTKPWLAERGVDVTVLLEADDAVQIVSGKQGRAKLIYSLPRGHNPVESLTVKQKLNIAEKETDITVLEFRCATRDGLTVQDVLPPSVHPDTGRPYRWGGKGDWRAIPEIPAALLKVWQQELLQQKTKYDRRKSCLSVFKGVDDTPRQRARVEEMLGHISADCSYELYRDMVWAIQSLGWIDVEEIAENWCRTAPERFNDSDFWNVVYSHDINRSPSFGTIHHHARKGGWHG